MRFTVPGKPQPKQRPRKGKHAWYTPKATRDYEQAVATAAMCAGVEMIMGRVGIRIVACFGDKRRRDIDNLKTIPDGLNGIAYADDSQIDYLEIRRVYEGEPRAEIEVWELSDE